MTPNTFEMDAHQGEGCPVAALGRTIGALDRRRDALDRLEVDEVQRAQGARVGPLTAYPESARDHVEDRRDELRATLASHRARSLAGCLCQVAQAESLVHDLFDYIDEPEGAAKPVKRAIERLLYSVAMHLEREAGTTIEDVGMGMVMSLNLNPWTACEERMAWVLAKNGKEGA